MKTPINIVRGVMYLLVNGVLSIDSGQADRGKRGKSHSPDSIMKSMYSIGERIHKGDQFAAKIPELWEALKGSIVIKKIISGGRKGVERAALDMAIKMEIPYGGWTTKGPHKCHCR